MLRTHFRPHTLILCLSLAATSGACSSSGSPDAPPDDTGSAGRVESGGTGGSGATAGSGQAGHGSVTGTGGTDSSTGSTTGDPGDRGGSDSGGAGTAGAGAGSGGAGTAGAGTAGAGTAGGAPDNSAAVARGRALATSNMCTTCHQEDYAGYAIYPNITPDIDTGIGSWSDQEIIDAIRSEKGRDNSTLCNLMVQFPFSDAQVSDVVLFLRSLPAASHEVDQVCPGHVP